MIATAFLLGIGIVLAFPTHGLKPMPEIQTALKTSTPRLEEFNQIILVAETTKNQNFIDKVVSNYSKEKLRYYSKANMACFMKAVSGDYVSQFHSLSNELVRLKEMSPAESQDLYLKISIDESPMAGLYEVLASQGEYPVDVEFLVKLADHLDGISSMILRSYRNRHHDTLLSSQESAIFLQALFGNMPDSENCIYSFCSLWRKMDHRNPALDQLPAHPKAGTENNESPSVLQPEITANSHVDGDDDDQFFSQMDQLYTQLSSQAGSDIHPTDYADSEHLVYTGNELLSEIEDLVRRTGDQDFQESYFKFREVNMPYSLSYPYFMQGLYGDFKDQPIAKIQTDFKFGDWQALQGMGFIEARKRFHGSVKDFIAGNPVSMSTSSHSDGMAIILGLQQQISDIDNEQFTSAYKIFQKLRHPPKIMFAFLFQGCYGNIPRKFIRGADSSPEAIAWILADQMPADYARNAFIEMAQHLNRESELDMRPTKKARVNPEV